MALFNQIMTRMGLVPKDTDLTTVIAERDQLLRMLSQLQAEYVDLREKTRVLMEASEKLKDEFTNLFTVMQNENNTLRATLVHVMESGGQKN